jgi:hypothetical protein
MTSTSRDLTSSGMLGSSDAGTVKGVFGMPMTYYELVVPDDMPPNEVEEVMTKTVSPSIDRQSTRVGMVEGDVLFRSLDEPVRYVWGIEWSGVGSDFVHTRVQDAVRLLTDRNFEVRRLVPAQDGEAEAQEGS